MQVVTYSSTSAGTVNLCNRHDSTEDRSSYGLTSIRHGQHEGTCDVCAIQAPNVAGLMDRKREGRESA